MAKRMRERKKEAGKSEAKIILNKKFYDKKTVKESLRAFHSICESSMKSHKDFFEIVFTKKANELDKNIELEFSNYVLALMKNKSLV